MALPCSNSGSKRLGIRIKQLLFLQDYALYGVIRIGNSWVPIPVTATETGPSTGLKMTVPSTAEEKTAKKNDVSNAIKYGQFARESSTKGVKTTETNQEEEIQANMALMHSDSEKNANNLRSMRKVLGSSVKPTTVCDKESDNSKENTDDSLKQQQKTDSSSVKSPLKSNSQLNDKGFVDSGCSRHMTGNIAHLSDFKDFDGGYVTFGGGAYGGRITGKGTIKTDNLDFDDVYFVKELKFNLFSVSQMCDKKNYVLFTDSECLVLSPNFKLPDENQILLKIPRQDNMYSFDMKNIVPKDSLTCLVAKATSEESMLWHRRLGHINFKNINKLVKENLVRDLPLKRFENDQTCVACLKGKQHRASCKTKAFNPITKPLFMLHMDLFGPTFVSSLMHKKYCLVVTDDYSRFSWVFFLTTKDETSEILKFFIKEVENLVDKKVKIIRSDNGTEFKNKVLDDFCREKGIKRKYRVLIVNPHNKTPYELFRGFKPAIGFMKPFGCHVTILNTLDNLGTFDGKSDESFFVGYSLSSKAFRVYNTRTKKVQENLHIGFLENKPLIEGNGPKWLFDIDSLTQSMNYVPVVAGTFSNNFAGIQGVSYSSTYSPQDQDNQDCIVMPIWKDASYFGDAASRSIDDAQIQDKDGLHDENDATEKSHDDSSLKDNGTVVQQVNTVRLEINTGSIEVSTVVPKVNTANLEDLVGPSHASEDTQVENQEIELRNIPQSYAVPTTPHKRIYKDHRIEHVIGDVQSSVEAMQEELLQFKLQKVWILVDLPKGHRAIGTKWVYKNKKDKRGIVIRNKARLVAQGHTQEEGIDYDEDLCHVARIEAIRMFWLMTSIWDFWLPNGMKAIIWTAKAPVLASMIGFFDVLSASRPILSMFAVCACGQGFQGKKQTVVGHSTNEAEYCWLLQVAVDRFSGYKTNCWTMEFHVLTSNESPLHVVHSHGSDEGSLKLYELTNLVTKLSARIGVLEDDLKKTKQTYSSAFTKLILKIKKLEFKVKTGKARQRARVVLSEDEEDDSFKQGRKLSNIDEEPNTYFAQDDEVDVDVVHDQDTTEVRQPKDSTAGITVSTAPISFSTARESYSTAGRVYGRRKRQGLEEAIRLQQEVDEEEKAQIARDEEIARQLLELDEERVTTETKTTKDIDWNDPSIQKYWDKKNKPKSEAQARKNMIVYLKNQSNYKMKDFEGMSYAEIRPIFAKVWNYNHNFVPMDLDIGKEKKKPAEFQQIEKEQVEKDTIGKRKKSLPRKKTRSTTKRQKVELDDEKEDLKGYLDIVPREDVAEDVESLSTKYPIMDWKTYTLSENFMYYKIIRGDGSSKNYKILSEMLYDFDRQDVVELYRLVKERYSSSKPEGYDLMLWGDLHTLFEPDEESEIWMNQNEYNLISWSLCDFCGVHILLMQNGIAIHMLTEKKYPLSQEMISKMLSKRLEVDQESTQAYELLKFIRSQVKK
ncbi:putative ribonuclease H-like domain-containing protein [Tanacetum coccineum]|uniref:Ribonuclease H-like domain-containing protein n=1 Tax=Tanacetum coccineum TaxID=301880 RepID=A0ABQ5BXP0_9ASTR